MQASTEVAEALRRYLAALASGDADSIDAMISREAGVTAIGSDPSEVWQSGDEWASSLRSLLEQTGGLPVAADEPRGFIEGSVGWTYDLPKITMPGREDLSFRMAAVFHLEGDDWKLVMLHASMAVNMAAGAR